MSIVSARVALETALNAITPAIATAWDNVPYKPISGTPYQAAYLLLAKPENPTMGSTYFRLQGIMQVSLFYPLSVGTATAAARAELIRSTFKRGYTFSSGGVTVIISETPEISTGRVDGDRWMIPVKIPWFAGIT